MDGREEVKVGCFGRDGVEVVVFRTKNWRACVSVDVSDVVIANDRVGEDVDGSRQLDEMPPVGFLGPDGKRSVA